MTEKASTATTIGSLLRTGSRRDFLRTSAFTAVAAGALVSVPHGLNLRRPLAAVWDPRKKLPAAAETLLDIATISLRDARSAAVSD